MHITDLFDLEGSKFRGKKVKAYDKLWIVLMSLFGDLHLAIEAGSTLPAKVSLIRLPSEEKAFAIEDVKSETVKEFITEKQHG